MLNQALTEKPIMFRKPYQVQLDPRLVFLFSWHTRRRQYLITFSERKTIRTWIITTVLITNTFRSYSIQIPIAFVDPAPNLEDQCGSMQNPIGNNSEKTDTKMGKTL
jgi:hypothetical protein